MAIRLLTSATTGTVHAVSVYGATEDVGPHPLSPRHAACHRRVSGTLGTGTEHDVTCGDCLSQPLHLPQYRAT